MTNQRDLQVWLVESFLEELADDYVGLREIPFAVRLRSPGLSDQRVLETSIGIVEALLAAGARPGQLDGSTGEFVPWRTGGETDRVTREWRLLGRDPDIAEICWFAM